MRSNPERVVAVTSATTPLGLDAEPYPFPRVAGYGNPGLIYTTPLGLDAERDPFPRVAGYGNPGLIYTTPLGLDAEPIRFPG